MRGCLENDRLFVLLITLLAGFFLCTSCREANTAPDLDIGTRSARSADDVNSIAETVDTPAIQFAADANEVDPNTSGPKLVLSYSKETFRPNPIASFMYFVPLIAPTRVDNISSVNNQQQIGILSHQIKADSKSFHVICEFEIVGNGFHKNTFEPAGMIATHTEELKKGRAMTQMLDYIKFEGQGFGMIEIKGQIAGADRIVTEVNMQFNAKGRKSPVTIGLYDIKPKGGQYQYENRSNQVVARVNSLAFKRTPKTPKLGIKVASISKSEDAEGFWGRVKGAIANTLIEPPKIDELGNTTMLEFGEKLLHKKTAFTFPKADNIVEKRIVEVFPAQQ